MYKEHYAQQNPTLTDVIDGESLLLYVESSNKDLEYQQIDLRTVELPEWRIEDTKQSKRDDTKLQTIIRKLWNRFTASHWIKVIWSKLEIDVRNDKDVNTIPNLEVNQRNDYQLEIIIMKYAKNPLQVAARLLNLKNLPKQYQYLADYPNRYQSEKYWHDIAFSLWETPLARLQLSCSCRSGQQIPSCCAHCSTALWLLHYSICGDIKKVLKPSKNDMRIKKNLISLIPYHKYKIKHNQISSKDDSWGEICLCKNSRHEWNEDVIECSACSKWYHPKCFNQSMKEIREFGLESFWRCPNCSDGELYLSNKIGRTY